MAALAVIRRDGPNASMEAIASEAGVTKPVVYAHFGDKAGLSAAIARRVARELIDQVTAGLAAATRLGSRDPRDAIPVTVEAFVSFVEADPELFSYLLYPSLGRSPGEDLRSLIENIATPMEPFFSEAAGEPETIIDLDVGDEVPAEVALRIRAALGLAYTSVDWWIRGGRDRMSRDELVSTVTSLVLTMFDQVGQLPRAGG